MLHSKARQWRVLCQHATYHSALPLTALPLSLPFSTSCLPLLLRWPNNSFTLNELPGNYLPLIRELLCIRLWGESLHPQDRGPEHRAAFFLPGSSPSLHSSDGIDAFC